MIGKVRSQAIEDQSERTVGRRRGPYRTLVSPSLSSKKVMDGGGVNKSNWMFGKLRRRRSGPLPIPLVVHLGCLTYIPPSGMSTGIGEATEREGESSGMSSGIGEATEREGESSGMSTGIGEAIQRERESLGMSTGIGKGTKRKREDVRQHLPDELVEKIVAMMQFPYVFQARLLSKSWLARFQPISSLADAEKKLRAASFQKQVKEWSNRWETFSPVFASFCENDVTAYRPFSSQDRPDFPSLPFLPGCVLTCAARFLRDACTSLGRPTLSVEGSMWYGTLESNRDERKLFVMNTLTHEWKQLPSLFDGRVQHARCLKLVCDSSSESYKVISLCQDIAKGKAEKALANVYSSKSGKWSSNELVFQRKFDIRPDTCAFFNEILYVVRFPKLLNLLAFNVEEGTVEELPLSFSTEVRPTYLKLVNCNAGLVMIAVDLDHRRYIHVLKVDLASLRLTEVAGSPIASVKLGVFDLPVNKVQGIFMEIGRPRALLVTYNQHDDKWSFFKYPKQPHDCNVISFQPALNPFMAV